MKLLKMDKPSCLIYSAAMVLGCNPSEIILFLGTDGLVEWFPEAKGSKKFRGIHMQEIQDYAQSNQNSAFFPVDFNVALAPDPDTPHKCIMNEEQATERMVSYMRQYDGIITVSLSGVVQDHACAWNHKTQRVLDPRGHISLIDDYTIVQFWARVIV
jgi:hypothetical protein